jgi:hypothetical protein
MAMEPKLMPLDLKLVAGMFIISGILMAIDMLTPLVNGRLEFALNFGVIQIPIGFGLLTLKQRWRRWAIIYLVISSVILILFVILALYDIRIAGEAPHKMEILFALVGIISLMLWMYRVLTKPSTLELFDADNRTDNEIVTLNLRDG